MKRGLKLTTYIEPFLGGGAVALSLLPSSPKPFLRWPGGKRKLAVDVVEMLGLGDSFERMILADVNEPLMALWRAVRDDPKGLFEKLLTHPRIKDYYVNIRSATRTPDITLYLSLFSFNGLQRVNSKGIFNAPPGYDLETMDLDKKYQEVLAVSEALRQRPVDITAADFETTMARASSGDFVYCDPPYIGTFTGYSGRFGVDEHVKLWQAAVAATMRGARVVISNSAAALPMYEGWARDAGLSLVVKHVEAFRSIGAKASSKQKTTEIMISLSP